MAYYDTGIHGVSLIADGQSMSAFGSSVSYGANCSLMISASLAADAPQAGTLKIHVDIASPDGYGYTIEATHAVNPGDGVTWNVGIGTVNTPGPWTATVTLSADVPMGTQGMLVSQPFWTVGAPSALELSPGNYSIQVTITNLSTSGGQPIEAVLDTKVKIFWSEMPGGGYYQGWTSRNPIAAGGSKVNTYNWNVPAGWAGTSGSIEVSVLDPAGNELASAILEFNVV